MAANNNNNAQIFGQSALQGLGNLAGSLPSALISGGFGILNSYLSNKWATEKENKARQENFEYNEKSAEAADARTRALYNDFYAPAAQMKLIKEAGLSPSIFAGGSLAGISGQSGAQGEGASGIAPNVFGMPNIDLAQHELATAQARKLNAEADEIQGLNTMGEAKIANILQDTATKLSQQGLNEAATALTTMQTEIAKIEKEFKNTTFWSDVAAREEQIKLLQEETKKTAAEASSAITKSELDKATFDDECKIVRNQVMLLASEINLNKATRKKLLQEADSIAYKMQLDYWHALLEGNKFNFEVNVEKWNRLWKKYELHTEEKWKSAELDKEYYNIKWRTMGGIMSAGIAAAAYSTTKSKGAKTKKKK